MFKRSAAVVVFSADLLRKTMTLFVDLANLGEMAVADLLRKTMTLFVVRALYPFDDNIRLLISAVRRRSSGLDRRRRPCGCFPFLGSLSSACEPSSSHFRPRSAIVSRFSARPGGLTDCLFAHMSVYRARDRVKRRAGQGNTRSSVLVTAVTACSNVRPPWT